MTVSGRAYRRNSWGARHICCGALINTNLPRTVSNHSRAVCSVRPAGGITTSPSTMPLVAGLHASNSASSVCTLGSTMSTCSIPARHPFHVPYCSFRAVTPQLSYSSTNQSCAAARPGVPASRGPMRSMSTCASCSVWEFTIPTSHILRMTESWVGKVWAAACAAGMIKVTAMARQRVMCMRAPLGVASI